MHEFIVDCHDCEKSRWRHIRFAIKPRYLGNHASQMKNYRGTLSGSNGRFIRIRHENSPEAPPGGEITMTSYPPCNKTSLSQKPSIPDKKLIWNTIDKSRSLFQNPSWKSREAPPGVEITICLIWLAIKARYLGNHALQIKIYYWSLSGCNGHSFRIHQKKIAWSTPWQRNHDEVISSWQ